MATKKETKTAEQLEALVKGELGKFSECAETDVVIQGAGPDWDVAVVGGKSLDQDCGKRVKEISVRLRNKFDLA